MEEQLNPVEQKPIMRNVYVQKHGVVVNTDLQTGREINYSADIELARRSRENYFSMDAMDNSREEITRGYLTQAASGFGGGVVNVFAEGYNFVKNTTFNVVNNAVTLLKTYPNVIAKQSGNIDEEQYRFKQDEINQEYENIAQFGREELLKLKDRQNKYLQKAGLGKEEGDTFIYDLSNGASSLLGALALTVITKSPNAAAVMFGGIAGQSGYEEALQNGVAPNKALGVGIARGVAEGSLEKIGLHVFLEGMAARGFFTRALKGFATEAIQEGSQQTAEEFIQSQFGGRTEDFKTAIKSIAASALLGGLLGGPVSAVGGIFMKEGEAQTKPTAEKTAAQKDSNTVEIPQDPKRIMAMVAYNGAKQLEGFGLAPEKAEKLAWAIVKETGSGKTIADMKEMIADELNPLTYTNAKEEDSAAELAATLAPQDTKPQYEEIRQKAAERFVAQGLRPEEAEIGGIVEKNVVQMIAAQQKLTPEQAAQQLSITVEQELSEDNARARLIQQMSTMDGAAQDDFWKNAKGKTFNEKLKELNLYRNKLAAQSGMEPSTEQEQFQPENNFNFTKEETQAELPEFKPKEKPEKIEDFGEKLEGAKKDIWKKFKETIEAPLPKDTKDITIAKVFPEPDYERAIAEGISVYQLAAIKAIKDMLPAKPKNIYRLARWTEYIKSAKRVAEKILKDENELKDFKKLLDGNYGFSYYRPDEIIKLYLDLGYPYFTKAKGYRIESGRISGLNGGIYKTPIEKIIAIIPSGREYFDDRESALNWMREKLEEKPSEARTTKLDIYQRLRTREIIIGKKIGSGKFIDLKGGFETGAAARKYLAENEERLLALLKEKKKLPEVRRAKNETRLGTDYRKGEDIKPERFASEFGFRGVQFGNWVEQTRRGDDLNLAYDSLLDLADVLGIPARAISLNGTLGLAFGARGSGKASAHYESGNVVINLTKTRGAGSLAHEWWHALDNHFGKREGKEIFASDWKNRPADNVRAEVKSAFDNVIKTINDMGMPERAKKFDELRSEQYWGNYTELGARAFEAYIIEKGKEKGFSNDYLANIISEEAWEKQGQDKEKYQYPTKEEMPAITKAFDNLFNTLKTKKTEKGIIFYQSASEDVFKAQKEEADQYRNYVDNLFKKGLRPSMAIATIGKTPEIYTNFNLPQKPLGIPVNIIKKAVVDKHSLTEDNIKHLPEMIADPLLILKSATQQDSLVAVIDDTDKNGDTIIVILKPTTGKINVIPSAYGKEKLSNFIKKEIKAGRLLYLDEKKASARLSGVQFPARGKGSLNSVQTKEAVVKTYNQSRRRANVRISTKDGFVKAIIEASKKSDESSFVHEMAHIWLKVFEGVYTKEDYQEIRQDLDNWLGKPRAGVYSEAQQEKFAEGFEKYLSEGKAPLPYLEQVFQQFRAWLINCYNGIDTKQISDAARNVYAKMLGAEKADAERTVTFYQSAKKDYGKMRDTIEKIKADKLEIKDLNGLDLEKLKEFVEILNKPAPAMPKRTLITDLRSAGASYANANQTDAEVFKNARVPNRTTGIGDKPANWLRDRGYMEFEDAKTYDEQTKIDEQAHELINKALNGEDVYKLEDLPRVQLHQDYLEAVKMAQDAVGGSTQTYNKVIKSIELLRKKGFRVVNKADLSFMEQKIEEVANLLEGERLIAQANTSMEREELKRKGRADEARQRKYADSIKEYKDKATAIKKAIIEELGRRELDGKEKALAAMEKASTVEEIYAAADDVLRFIEDVYGNTEAGKQSKAKYALPEQDWDNRRLELLKDLKEINQKTDINATWARTAIEREGRITPHRAGITQQDINTPAAIDERQRKINLWKAEKILDEQLRNRYYKAFESALSKIPALKAQQKALMLSAFNRIGYANKAAPALADEILNKAKEYVEKNYKNTIQEKIKEILQMPIFEKHGSLRTAKYTQTAQKFLRRAYEISSLTDEQAQDSFRVAAEKENYDEAKSKEQKLLDRLLQFKAAPYMVTPEAAKQLLDDMEELRRASRSEVRFAKFFKDTGEEILREKLITAMEKQKIPAGGATYVKKLANWQSFVNTLFGTHEFDYYDNETNAKTGPKKVKINFMDVLSLEQNDIKKKNHIAEKHRQIVESVGRAYGYKNGNDYIKKMNEMLGETYTFDNYGAIDDNDPTQTERQKKPFKENINKLELLFFWIQSQNEWNNMRLGRAYRDQYATMFNALSAEDKAAGRELMKIAQSTWEAMNTVHERDRGFSLGKAQNYFPNRVERIEGGLDFLRGALTSNAAPSAIKQRVQTDKVIEKAVNPISLLMGEITRNAEYIYGSEDINKLRRIFRTFEMKTAFENKFGTTEGKEIYQKFLKMIDLNSPSVTLKANSGFFEAAEFLFNNWIKSSIGLKPITAIKQFASTFNYAEDMPVGYWVKGFTEALANPKETIKFMKELSPYIQTRFEQGGMNETLGRAMSMNEVTGAAAKINLLTNSITFNVRYGDMYSLCFGGKPYVDYLMKEKGYTRQQAQEAFEKATVRSQQADLKSTLAEAQMEEGNLFWRAAWSFRNQQMQYVRKMADAYVDFKNGNIDEKAFAKKIFIYGVINPAIYTLLSMGFFAWDDDDKEDDYWRLSTSPVTQFAGAVPFGDDLTELMFSNLRSLINKGQLTGAKGYELPGIVDMGYTFNKFVKNFNADDVTLSDWLDVLADAGQFSGFGTKTIKTQIGGAIDVLSGKPIKGGMQILGYTENRAGKVTGQEKEKRKRRKNKTY